MHAHSVFSTLSDIMVQFLDLLLKEGSATSLVLQLHNFLGIFSFLLRLVKRLFSRVLQSHVITVQAVRWVDIGGVQLQTHSVLNAYLWDDWTLCVIP